jgi:hypothetical protein
LLWLLGVPLAACVLAGCASSTASTAPAPATIEPTAAESASGAPGGEETEPCRRAVRGDSPVARACRDGGVRSAKATMKALITEGRGAGIRLACDDCHLDSADFARLSPEAPDKLRTLLAAIGRR